MTVDEFRNLFADRLRGLLIRAYSDCKFAQHGLTPEQVNEMEGRLILEQMQAGQKLLNDICSAVFPKEKPNDEGNNGKAPTPATGRGVANPGKDRPAT